MRRREGTASNWRRHRESRRHKGGGGRGEGSGAEFELVSDEGVVGAAARGEVGVGALLDDAA